MKGKYELKPETPVIIHYYETELPHRDMKDIFKPEQIYWMLAIGVDLPRYEGPTLHRMMKYQDFLKALRDSFISLGMVFPDFLQDEFAEKGMCRLLPQSKKLKLPGFPS